MSTTGVRATVRPVRVGWCVRHGDLEELRRAIRLSTMLWGGRFNLVITVDDVAHAQQLTELFHVDVLLPVDAGDPLVDGFIAQNKHLQWPSYEGPLLLNATDTIDRKPRTKLLDTRFVMTRVREQNATREAEIDTVPAWAPDDPVADALLVTFGEYPADQWGDQLRSEFRRLGGATEEVLSRSEPLPGSLWQQLNPLDLTGYGLTGFRGSIAREGIFIGAATSYDDLVDCWNLNAAGNSVLFLDPRHLSRQADLFKSYISSLEHAAGDHPRDDLSDRLHVWSRDGQGLPPELQTSLPLLRSHVHRVIWNGLNVIPPFMVWPLSNTIATVSREQHRPTLTFQFDVDKLLGATRLRDQYWVISAQPYRSGSEAEGFTFAVPNIPELNGYYGREMLFDPYRARVGPDGLGIITESGTGYLTIAALSVTELFQKIFSAWGMEAKPSRPGLIARRLIHQMGGLQSCRVFKIAGVRRLISAFSATEAFTYHQAINHIKDQFEPYQKLFIAPRNEPKLEPRDAFLFLLDKGVFRTGMNFICPACELELWVPLDDVRTQLGCEYCGVTFNTTPRLPDRNVWRYRRSGLFGRENHQEGGIPVCLALQRLDTSVRQLFRESLYTTGLEISTPNGSIPPCEIDFVFLSHNTNGRVQLALGEAKGGKEVSEDDVANLLAVAAALPRTRFDVFPTFAKTGELSTAEIERCLEPPDTYPRRRILLTRPELEPYDLHERLSALPSRLSYTSDLEGLAEASFRLYWKEEPHPESRNTE